METDGQLFLTETGTVAVTSIAAGLVRVRMAPGELAPARSWDVTRDGRTRGCFERRESGPQVWLGDGVLEVEVDTATGMLSFRGGGGAAFGQDVRPVAWRRGPLKKCRGLITRPGERLPKGRGGIRGELVKALVPEERLYGFGQRTLSLNRRGSWLTNWTDDPSPGHSRTVDPMYQAHPFFLSMRPGLAWGLFLNCTWYSAFDAGKRRPDELALVTLGGEIDYYVLYGPDPASVVEKLTRLTGRPPLPPLWSLGFHQSRWGYREADQILNLAHTFRERDLPLDVIHLDIDYMHDYRSFTFHPERFPDPGRLVEELDELGVRAVTIIDPGIRHDLASGYRTAREGALQGMFLADEGGAPYIGYCWPDAAMFADFSRPEVRSWWGDQHRDYLQAGIAGIWNDMNEPAIFDQPFSRGLAGHLNLPLALECGPAEEPTIQAEVHNLYGLQMCQGTREGLLRHRPGVRPWVLSRSGFTGIQRYAAVWMGDNSSWWEHLELSVPQLASMGISGSPHCGVDIGGFADHCHPELFARWIQLGTFYPFMRNHCARGALRQEPWRFGAAVEEISREALRLRYRLLPYLYTLAHRASRTGEPILRPMFYDFPGEPGVWAQEDQFMFGPLMLVAPVVRAGHRHRLVVFPEGVWFDFWTGERYQGPTAVAVEAPMERIPLFLRAGAILTLGPLRRSTREPLDRLHLHVYPGEGEWSLIEDDGISLDAPVCQTGYRVRSTESGLELIIEGREGAYTPPPRELDIAVHGVPAPVDVRWDGEVEGRRFTTVDDGGPHRLVLGF